jgi:hypothetical protein
MDFTGRTLPTASPAPSLCDCENSKQGDENPCVFEDASYQSEIYLVLQPLQADTLSFTLTLTVNPSLGQSLDFSLWGILILVVAGIIALLVAGCLASVFVIGGLMIRKRQRTAVVDPNHDICLDGDEL